MMARLGAALLLAAALAGPGGPAGGGAASGAPFPPGLCLRVAASYPSDGMVGLFTDTVVVRFREPLDPASVDSGLFRMERSGMPVPGSAALMDGGETHLGRRTVVWTPDAPLPPASGFRFLADRGIRSVRGRVLEDPFTAAFTTDGSKPAWVVTPVPPDQGLVRAPRLGPPPRVRWTFPQAGFGNVYSDEVRVRFNRPMDPGALEGGAFRILQDGDPLPGTVSFPEEWGLREVLFVPERPLFRDTTFQMVVTRDARTRQGRFLREEFRAGFGTSPFKGGVKPLKPGDFAEPPVPLSQGRAFHTACVLFDGRVLAAGGQDLGGNPLSSTELFGAGGASREDGPALAMARRKHAAATLKDGRVLVCGGFGPTGSILSSVEIYDPATGAWTEGPPMREGRASHTVTVFDNGKVLAAGGYSTDQGWFDYARTAEILDPRFGSWTATASPPVAERGGHTATLLPDGRVFLAGGTRPTVLVDEVYVPGAEAFLTTATPLEHRVFHAAALTKSGTVLLAGGGPPRAEQFDPSRDSFSDAGSCPPYGLPVSESPYFATLTRIPGGGRIALIGGLSVGGGGGGSDLVLAQVQLWDPSGGGGKGAFFPMLFDLEVPRAAHTVTPLFGGSFLILGGFGTGGPGNESRVTVFTPSQ